LTTASQGGGNVDGEMDFSVRARRSADSTKLPTNRPNNQDTCYNPLIIKFLSQESSG